MASPCGNSGEQAGTSPQPVQLHLIGRVFWIPLRSNRFRLIVGNRHRYYQFTQIIQFSDRPATKTKNEALSHERCRLPRQVGPVRQCSIRKFSLCLEQIGGKLRGEFKEQKETEISHHSTWSSMKIRWFQRTFDATDYWWVRPPNTEIDSFMFESPTESECSNLSHLIIFLVINISLSSTLQERPHRIVA